MSETGNQVDGDVQSFYKTSVKLWCSHLLLLTFLLLPTVVHADSIVPILNFFHGDTWLPASIGLLVIVLLESFVLHRRIKTMSFGVVLWKSLVLNVVSSLTGSVLLLVLFLDSYFIWDSIFLVLPLFLITLAAEIPMLQFLFRDIPLSWERATKLGLWLNVVSYVCVFILQIGLLIGWLSYTGHLDKRELALWNNPNLLNQASGRLYVTEAIGLSHRLQVYDWEQQKWARITSSPPVDPNIWDVEGDAVAFVSWPVNERIEKHLIVVRLRDGETRLELSPDRFADARFEGWQGITAVAVSPDQKKLAILFRLADAMAPRNRFSHFNLGGKCRLLVIDIDTGAELARSSRWASERDLCWLPDSHHVLFSSYDDESLYETPKSEIHGASGFAPDGKFKQGLYRFNVDLGTTARFADGTEPALAVKAGQILIRDPGGFALLDAQGNRLTQVGITRLGFRRAVVSSCGNMIVAGILRHRPLGPPGRLVLFHKDHPDIRHVLDDDSFYRIDWSIGDNEMSNQGIQPTPQPAPNLGTKIRNPKTGMRFIAGVNGASDDVRW